MITEIFTATSDRVILDFQNELIFLTRNNNSTATCHLFLMSILFWWFIKFVHNAAVSFKLLLHIG